MANKEIHELITAEELSSSDVIAEQRNNSGTWLTRKLTFNMLGLFLNKVLNYASDLHTTSKTIIGAINELAQGSGQSLDTLNDVDIDDQTLTDGQGIVYDATAQKWKNGAVSGGHTYSTTEQVVGTWIDGSPVYEKTIVLSSELQIGANSWEATSELSSGMDTLVDIVALSSTGTVYVVFGAIDTGDYVRLYNVRSNAEIKVKTFTIRYTKTST